MNATVQKWGNSLALRIPSMLAKDIHLHRGSEVDVAVVKGKMVVKPRRQRKRLLSQMLRGITKQNLHSAQDWGSPMGRETE